MVTVRAHIRKTMGGNTVVRRHNRKIDTLSIHRHNWSMEARGKGKWKLTLGNMSDAGWFWDGDESDFMGFLIRIRSSKVTDEFIQDMKESGITLNMLKPLIMKSLAKDSGVYEISGDNRVWKFGEMSEFIFSDFIDGTEYEGWDEEKKEKLEKEWDDNLAGADFDDWNKRYGKDIKESLRKAVEQSSTWEDLLGKGEYSQIGRAEYDAIESVEITYKEELASDALGKALKNVEKSD